MLFGTYILYVLGAILPSLIFVFLFLSISKRIEFSFKFFVTNLVVGAFSTQLVLILHTIFPGFHDAMFHNKALSLFMLAFVQVGLIEELSKFFSFKLSLPAYRQRIEPITIFQISLIAAAAFSIMENLVYLDSGLKYLEASKTNYFINAEEVKFSIWKMLGGRAAFAVVLHLFCGATIGYFTSIGMTQNSKRKGKVSKFVNKTRKRRVFLYQILGIFIATIIHGAYDFNLFMLKSYGYSPFHNQKFTILLCGISIFMIRHMILDLNSRENETIKHEIPQ